MADPPENKSFKLVDPQSSQCDGLTYEGEKCNSLCGRPTNEGRKKSLFKQRSFILSENLNKSTKLIYPTDILRRLY